MSSPRSTAADPRYRRATRGDQRHERVDQLVARGVVAALGGEHELALGGRDRRTPAHVGGGAARHRAARCHPASSCGRVSGVRMSRAPRSAWRRCPRTAWHVPRQRAVSRSARALRCHPGVRRVHALKNEVPTLLRALAPASRLACPPRMHAQRAAHGWVVKITKCGDSVRLGSWMELSGWVRRPLVPTPPRFLRKRLAGLQRVAARRGGMLAVAVSQRRRPRPGSRRRAPPDPPRALAG